MYAYVFYMYPSLVLCFTLIWVLPRFGFFLACADSSPDAWSMLSVHAVWGRLWDSLRVHLKL